MAFSAKTVRTQIQMLQPLLRSCSLETVRKGQNMIGELMEARYRKQVRVHDHPFANFEAAWVLPRDERRQGVILYLHGGGYTCGDLDYAKGFGTMLAVHTGTRVFCIGYRLAPENPYPAALEDALESYRYLLRKGYTHIAICGESAGGGLCYSLCMKLRELGLPMPNCIIPISPWADLTGSGESYETNKENDPSMTRELLDFFADSYTDNRHDPLVSPLLGDLTGMPPSLIFAGGDEILLSDAQSLHEKLQVLNCTSQLVIRPQRWHGYLLYGLAEDAEDFTLLNRFLNSNLAAQNKLRWLPLDNAAKIYPAARRQNWSNVFRLSATLSKEVDAAVLQSALDVTARRFPSIAARLRKGVFWYYLQQLSQAPAGRSEIGFPLAHMSRNEMRKCALRVIVYGNRIAVEIFHSLTDGNGALIFLKTLVAEYLHQKHGLSIPAEQGVLGRLEEPSEEELEDSFQKYAGTVNASRGGSNAWNPKGTEEEDGFLNLTCFRLPSKAVLEKAHDHGVSVTTFLGAVMMMALQNLQEEHVPNQHKRRPVKILLPVNLRKIFPSRTLRNFALYTIPEIDPRLGRYEFDEICRAVRHRMGLDIEPKYMASMIAANVSSERIMSVKIMPLFIKNAVMKAIFNAVGERKSCLSLSNLGAVTLPEVMRPYVRRMDFILGIQATAPYNCGVISYGDTLNINFIRSIREPGLEYHFHRALQELGLTAEVESNHSGRV